MIKKILEFKSQMPIVTAKHPSFKPRQSQKSQISSTNSVSLASFQNIQLNNSKGKFTKRQARTSQMNISKNNSKLQKFQQFKDSGSSQKQVLQQKMQNVSCLYANFIYKNSQKNFIDDMKLQRYKILMQNQRVEKNQLLKQIQDMKQKINQSEKQKQTVMFAYRALEAKIKQKQRIARLKMKSHDRKQKLSINMSNDMSEKRQSFDSMNIQQQLMRSRKLLTSQGILNLYQQKQSQQLLTSFNKFCSSKSLCKYFQGEDGIKQWQQKQRRYNDMQKQLIQMKQKINKLTEVNQNQSVQIRQYSKDIQFYKQEYIKATQKIDDYEETIKGLNKKIVRIEFQSNQIQINFNNLNLRFESQQKQNQKKQMIIKQLQDTKYTYLMKQEKEKQQIQLLRKFTENLQLNDQKINQFIQTTFGNQVEGGVVSQDKLFKEDISYILHLIKKKQNIYNQLIKEYQQKHRETQTRCFLLQKKLHVSENFMKKLQAFTNSQQQQINQQPKLQKQITQIQNPTQPSIYCKQNKQISNFKDRKLNQNLNKQRQNRFNNIDRNIFCVKELKQMLQTYKLDKRLI